MGRVSRPGGEWLLWMLVVARQKGPTPGQRRHKELLLLGEAQVLGAREDSGRVLNPGQKKKEAGAPAGLEVDPPQRGSRLSRAGF